MRLKGTTVAGPEEVTFGHQELESLGKEVKEDALRARHCPGGFPVVSTARQEEVVWLRVAGPVARRGRPSADRAEVALGQGLSGKGSACSPKPWAPDTHRVNLCRRPSQRRLEAAASNPNLKTKKTPKSEAREGGVSAATFAGIWVPEMSVALGHPCNYSPCTQPARKRARACRGVTPAPVHGGAPRPAALARRGAEPRSPPSPLWTAQDPGCHGDGRNRGTGDKEPRLDRPTRCQNDSLCVPKVYEETRAVSSKHRGIRFGVGPSVGSRPRGFSCLFGGEGREPLARLVSVVLFCLRRVGGIPGASEAESSP